MAGFLDCLDNEFQQGLVNADLYDDFRKRWDSDGGGLLGRMNPQARADEILQEMKVSYDEGRRRALLGQAAAKRVAAAMQDYTNRKGMPDAGEFALELWYSPRLGESSINARADSLFTLFTQDLSTFFLRYRRADWSGVGRHRAELADVVRERAGEQTNNPEARTAALAIEQVLEKTRVVYNEVGGNLPKLKKFILPQLHNPTKIEQAGYVTWRDSFVKDLDLAEMIDGRTGKPINPANLEDALQHVFNDITTSGLGSTSSTIRGSGGGAGGFADKRLHHRFLIFKNADAWLRYQKRFGEGSLVDVLFSHIRGMSKDIAVMQILGPEPEKTVMWLAGTRARNDPDGGVIGKEMRRYADGDASAIFPSADDKGQAWSSMSTPRDAMTRYANSKRSAVWNAWDHYTGAAHSEGSQTLANVVGTSSNVFLSASLGSTTFIAQTDQITGAVARAYAGLPWWRGFTDYLRAVGPGGRQEALEMSILSESMLNTFMTEMRYLGPLYGPRLSRWLVERSMVVSLLKPHTAAMKHGFGMTFYSHLANISDRTWSDLDAPFRDLLTRYGLSEPDWDAVRLTTPRVTQRGLTHINARDVAYASANLPGPRVTARPGMTAREELALRLMEIVRVETEFAVPSGTARTERVLSKSPGTLQGAVFSSFAKLKSYAWSAHTMHMYRVFEMLSKRQVTQAAAYLITLIAGGTGLAFLMQQGSDRGQGKTGRQLDDAEAWMEAALKGSAMGVFSEPLVLGQSEDGRNLVNAMAGPLFDQIAQTYSTGKSWADYYFEPMWTGEEPTSNPGRETVKLLKKITPFTTTWYFRLAMARFYYDELQRMLDPNADEAFERSVQWLEEKKRQQYWWAPGQREPDWQLLKESLGVPE